MRFSHQGLSAGLTGLVLCACGEQSPAAGLSYPQAPAAKAEARTIKRQADVRARVSQDPGGGWRVAYDFDTPQTALVFERGAGIRAGRWRPLTPGVEIVDAGGFDAMIFDEPGSEAAFAFTPYTAPIARDYTPFLPFSDGGVALFTGWFDLVEEKGPGTEGPGTESLDTEDLGAVRALDGLADAAGGEDLSLALTIETLSPLVADGAVVKAPYTVSSPQGTYIYVGPAAPVTAESFTGIIDPGLPAWLRRRLDGDLYSVFLAHEAAWDMSLDRGATVLLAYRGADRPGFSNKGSVIGNVLAASVSGQDMLQETPEILTYLNWFFAHEAAHLFHEAAGAPDIDNDDAWMHEGAASGMAYGIAGALGGGPDYVVRSYAASLESCDAVLSEGPGRAVEGGGEFYDVAYHCGALIALLTDAMLPERGIADFWREAGRGWEEGSPFHTADYLSVLLRMGAEPDPVQAVSDLIEMSHKDPKGAFLAVMTEAGLAPKLGKDGRLAALDFPR